MVAHKAIRYRMYPTKEQSMLLNKTIGCARFVYNKMLEDKIAHYQKTGEMLKNTPAMYNNEFPWLREVDSLALANAQLNLETAFRNFFRDVRVGFPKFKSRHKERLSYTTNVVGNNLRIVDGNRIRLPKIGAVRCKMHRTSPKEWKLKSATVCKERDGSYYISMLYEYEEHVTKKEVITAVGLDYKSDGLYMDSNGNCPGSPKYYRKAHKALAKAQRKLARAKKGSANREKTKAKIAKIHRHIANQRKDFLHKESLKIANSYDLVCVEDLNLRAMANKGFGNGKVTLDNGYGMFLFYLEYKLHDRGGHLVKVGKWYPSSRICSSCGHKADDVVTDLSIRKWICPVCGSVHDRDINAAMNILNEGLKLFESSASQ